MCNIFMGQPLYWVLFFSSFFFVLVVVVVGGYCALICGNGLHIHMMLKREFFELQSHELMVRTTSHAFIFAGVDLTNYDGSRGLHFDARGAILVVFCFSVFSKKSYVVIFLNRNRTKMSPFPLDSRFYLNRYVLKKKKENTAIRSLPTKGRLPLTP